MGGAYANNYTSTQLEEIQKALTVLVSPGEVVELRILGGAGKGVYSGYFNNLEAMAKSALAYSGKAKGIYFTINPAIPDLLARAENKLKERAEVTTSDRDIKKRVYLPIDLDANRPAGISSTQSQHEAAIKRAYSVAEYLVLQGFSQSSMVIADSGNGAHVLVRIDLPNDAESTTLCQEVLKALDLKFTDEVVSVDQTTYNASRIMKLYGTLVMKGDNTAERPHRIAHLLRVPETLVQVASNLLEKITKSTPKPSKSAPPNGHKVDLDKFLTKYNIEVSKIKDWQGAKLHILKQCPFNTEHHQGEASVIQWPNGALDFSCHHNSCKEKKWADFRKLYEPDYQSQQGKHWSHEYHLPLNNEEYNFQDNCTDTANSEYFTEMYRNYLRFNHRKGEWLRRRNKHYYEPDNDGEVHRLAIKAIRHRFLTSLEIKDLKTRTKVASWCIGSEDKSRIEAQLSIASKLKPLAESGEDFDIDPWLVAVKNGVIDLRTGQIRDGKPEDNITMHSNVTYDPQAKCPRFLQFFAQIFNYDYNLIYWVWRYIGYSMTGITKEQIWAICYGTGENGKGVLFWTLLQILGDYGHVVPFTTFEATSQQDIPSDLAMMVNKRLVTASETLPGSRLNEQRLKALAGEDTIQARFMHKDWFEFTPVAKIWIAVNHKPKVQDDTHGFWRKVRLIPFNQQFSQGALDTDHKKDPDLKQKLAMELSGILNWMLAGCQEWQRMGLSDLPPAISQATENYKNESDTVKQFVYDMCVTGQDEYSIKASELYAKYKEWAYAQGTKSGDILTNTAFGTSLTQSSKYNKKHHRDGWYYHGLRIRQLDDPIPDMEEPKPVTGNVVMSSDVTGYLKLCDGLKGVSPLTPNSNSRVGINGKNPSQPVTEATNPSQGNVTGYVTGTDNPSQPQNTPIIESVTPPENDLETVSMEEARKMVEEL